MKNSAILCTIHQPSSEVFLLFDLAIFMKAGRIFYQGPVSKIGTYFSDLDEKCPENYNPADFVMNLCQSKEGDELERLFIPIPIEYQAEQTSSMRREGDIIEFTVASSFIKQMYNLASREFIHVTRDTASLCVRFGVTIMLNVLYGLIFLNVGGKDNGDAKNFNSHVGGVMMAMIYSMFGSAQPIMLAFPYERPMFMREFSTGTCKILSFLFYYFYIIHIYVLLVYITCSFYVYFNLFI